MEDTMQTLESLYAALGDCDRATEDAYSIARAKKVAEIAEWIVDYLREPQYAERIAEAMMSSAEEMGRISGNTITAEVASRYTKTGNPIPVII